MRVARKGTGLLEDARLPKDRMVPLTHPLCVSGLSRARVAAASGGWVRSANTGALSRDCGPRLVELGLLRGPIAVVPLLTKYPRRGNIPIPRLFSIFNTLRRPSASNGLNSR